MSIEQRPTLEQLQGKLARFDHTLEVAGSNRDKLRDGLDVKNPKYSLSGTSDFVDAIIAQGEAVLRIDQKTLPLLNTHRLNIIESIQSLENVRRLERLKRIEELFKQGAIAPEMAEKARAQLLGIIPLQVETPVVKTVVEVAEPLTPRQIAIMCTEIQRKNGWNIQYGDQAVLFTVDAQCLEVCRTLDSQHGGQNLVGSRYLSKQIKTDREEALRTMRDLVAEVVVRESRGEREYLDNLPTGIQHLVVQFMDWETQLSATNLYNFLFSTTDAINLVSGGVGYDEAQVREIIDTERVWIASHPFPKTKETIMGKTSPAELIRVEEPEILSGDVPAGPAGVVVSTAVDRRQRAIERQSQREEIRRERVRACLDKIYTAIAACELGSSNSGTWTGDAVVRVFNSLSRTTIQGLSDRRIIVSEAKTGSRFRRNAPRYSIPDIAVALYYHDFDRQITPKIVRDLEEIITEEIGKIEVEKNKKVLVA